MAGAVMLATAPDYEDLFNNLDPHDTAAIAQKLDDSHEKYQIVSGETAIRVPSADKDRLRMEMIRDGLPAKTAGVVGSDWLDKIGMSTTSDVQDQYIRMANEGELSQTIGSMTEIDSAAVHLSPGSNSPFAGDDTPPSASVVVGLKPGTALTSDQTMGIANLVAKAVPGLAIKNVAVMDTNGNQLWNGGDDASAPGGMASSRMVAQRQYSDDMRKQMQTYLDDVLGARKALVSVNAELDYNQVHSMQTSYAKGAVLSTQESDEKYQGGSGAQASATPAGMAGNTAVAGTTPQYPLSSGNGKNGNYDNGSSTTNYSNNKVETETQQATGGIQRLAVAVLVDSSVAAPTVNSIKSYISTLAGVVPGDNTRIVTVQSVPFSNADALSQQAQMKAEQAQVRQQEMLRIAAVAAVAITLLIIFLKSSRSTRQIVLAQTRRADGGSLSEGPAGMIGDGATHTLDEPMSIEQLLSEMPMAEGHSGGGSTKRAKPIVHEIEEQLDVKLESVRDMVKNHPQSVSLLIKGWISDEVDPALR